MIIAPVLDFYVALDFMAQDYMLGASPMSFGLLFKLHLAAKRASYVEGYREGYLAAADW